MKDNTEFQMWLEERFTIARKEIDGAESEFTESFWLGRLTLLSKIRESVELGAFEHNQNED